MPSGQLVAAEVQGVGGTQTEHHVTACDLTALFQGAQILFGLNSATCEALAEV